MHKLKLVCLAAIALFAFGAFTTSAFAVEAEETNNPRILVLNGTVAETEATLTGTNAELIQLSGANPIIAANVTATLKGCESIAGNTKDANLCKDQSIVFTGVKQGAVACRSENAKGEKDPVETVLVLLDLHVVAQKSTTGELQPALQAAILGNALEEEVKFNCGTVKIQVKANSKETKAGVIECLLLPGLKVVKPTENVEVLCKVAEKVVGSEKLFDPVVGTCEVLCTDFGAVGLVANLNGMEFKDAWELIHLKGKANKEIFIDD